MARSPPDPGNKRVGMRAAIWQEPGLPTTHVEAKDMRHTNTGRPTAGVALDPGLLAASLDDAGWADLGRLLSEPEIAALTALYPQEAPWRSHILMRRHGFGEGEYKYFAYPLPAPVARLRETLYPPLAAVANRWEERLGSDRRFPATLAGMLARCHADGQTRPTPLMLRYGAGDYNCLHQDLYGRHVFPLQVVILLSARTEFEGGELVLVEQRPRRQSRAEVVPLEAGHGVAIAVNERPRQGARGLHRVRQRHGVSRIRRGRRMTLGIIFHDAA